MTEETKPKLSELLRVGALKRPQCRHSMFNVGKSCALGAIYEGMMSLKGKDMDLGEVNMLLRLQEEYPALLRPLRGLMMENLYEGNDFTVTLSGAIITLNDKLQLTREEIADKLEAKGL